MDTLSRKSDFFTHSRADMYMREGNFRAAVTVLEVALTDVRIKEKALLEMLARAAHAAENGSAN